MSGLYNIGIIGCGFVGRAIYNGFSPNYRIFIYDKYKSGFHSLEEVLENCKVVFIGVPTPMNKDGSQDISIMDDVVETINKVANEKKIIILKSTILPGTTRKFSERYNHDFIFNPEFLTERNADFDFINQSRIVLGGKTSDDKSVLKIEKLYTTRFSHTPIHKCTFEEAELVKYICNCFFANKVSFMNEIYEICQSMNLDYNSVRNAFLGDFRIANSHTEVPGPDGELGFGGKCFPKDLNAFIIWGKKRGLKMTMFDATEDVNKRVRKIKDWENIVGATSENNYGKE